MSNQAMGVGLSAVALAYLAYPHLPHWMTTTAIILLTPIAILNFWKMRP